MSGDARRMGEPAAKGGAAADGRPAFFDALAEEWRGRGFPGDEPEKVLRLRLRLGDLEGAVVFEPGCGAGRLTRLLRSWVGPGGTVVAVDESERMVAEARVVLDEGDTARCGRIDLRHADALQLELPPRSVDLALLFCVFPHFRDKGAALARFASWLKPGGRLVISHLEGSERLNTFHEGAGEPVRRDRIPPRADLEEMLRGATLRCVEWVDTEGEFYLEARAWSPGPPSVETPP